MMQMPEATDPMHLLPLDSDSHPLILDGPTSNYFSHFYLFAVITVIHADNIKTGNSIFRILDSIKLLAFKF